MNVRHPRRAVAVRGLLVDSGSEFTWLPGRRSRRWEIGYAIVRAGGFETVDEVVFARPGDLSLLGARTLAGFGAVVDARGKRLVASGPHLVALAEQARRELALAVG